MKIKSCSNCYFYEECGTSHICSCFSPLEEPEMTERAEYAYIEAERKHFYKRMWNCLVEDDRIQDYFG